MTDHATRRQFLQSAAGALALSGVSARAFGKAQPSTPASDAGGLNLLTDPRFTLGAKFRMGQFVQKGADSKAAEAVFGSLPNLDAQPWVDA